jgi:hypothetical protein
MSFARLHHECAASTGTEHTWRNLDWEIPSLKRTKSATKRITD